VFNFPYKILKLLKYIYAIYISIREIPPGELTPLAALEHWTAGVLGAVVHVQGAVQVVPEEDVAHLWLNGDVQEGKGGGPALLHIRKLRGKVIALTKSYTGLARCHNSHKIWQWQCGCPPPQDNGWGPGRSPSAARSGHPRRSWPLGAARRRWCPVPWRPSGPGASPPWSHAIRTPARHFCSPGTRTSCAVPLEEGSL